MRINMQFFGAPDFSKMRTPALKKSTKSFLQRIEEHQNKIADPEKFCAEWNTYDDRHKEGLKKHWAKEIKNFSEQLEAATIELKKRGE